MPRERNCLQLTLTQDEVAEIIGVPRERVTRVLTGFKKKKLLTLKGATLTILDRTTLKRLANI